MQATRAQRGLSTARAALRVTWHARARARRVSVPTRWPRRSARASRPPTTCSPACATRASPSAGPAGCTGCAPSSARRSPRSPTATTSRGVVDDLLARTHKRAYLAVLRGGQLRIVLERGLQGMPKLPGMNPEIADNAHALALGKVVLALGPRDAVEQYARAGLKRFTPATITEPDALQEELRQRAAERRRDRARGVRARLLLPGRARASTTNAISSAPSASRCRGAPSTPSARSSRRRCATSSRFQPSADVRAVLDRGPRPEPSFAGRAPHGRGGACHKGGRS